MDEIVFVIRGTRGAYRGIPSTSKREDENETGSTERLDRPKKYLGQNKSGYGLGKRPDFSLKNRNVHLASSRYGQVSLFHYYVSYFFFLSY